MIRCEYCQQKNENDVLECRQCGAPLEDIQKDSYIPTSIFGGDFYTDTKELLDE